MEQNSTGNMNFGWGAAIMHEETPTKKSFPLLGGAKVYVELSTGREKVVFPLVKAEDTLLGVDVSLVYDNTYGEAKLNICERFTDDGYEGMYVNAYGDVFRISDGCTENGQCVENGTKMIERLQSRGVNISDFEARRCLRKGGYVKIFNNNGDLAAICDDFCHYVLFEYTADRVQRIVDDFQNAITFSYNSDGSLLSVEMPLGQEVSLDTGYVGIHYPNGEALYIDYENDRVYQLYTVSNESCEIQREYNQLRKIIHYLDNEEDAYLEFTYEDYNTVVTNEEGEQTFYVFDSMNTSRIRACYGSRYGFPVAVSFERTESEGVYTDIVCSPWLGDLSGAEYNGEHFTGGVVLSVTHNKNDLPLTVLAQNMQVTDVLSKDSNTVCEYDDYNRLIYKKTIETYSDGRKYTQISRYAYLSLEDEFANIDVETHSLEREETYTVFEWEENYIAPMSLGVYTKHYNYNTMLGCLEYIEKIKTKNCNCEYGECTYANGERDCLHCPYKGEEILMPPTTFDYGAYNQLSRKIENNIEYEYSYVSNTYHVNEYAVDGDRYGYALDDFGKCFGGFGGAITYDERNNISTMRYNNTDDFLSFTYDDKNRVTEVYLYGNLFQTYIYDDNSSHEGKTHVTITNAKGEAVEKHTDKYGRYECYHKDNLYLEKYYDEYGKLVQVCDHNTNDYTVYYDYDSVGNLTRIKECNGTEEQRINYNYTDRGQLAEVRFLSRNVSREENYTYEETARGGLIEFENEKIYNCYAYDDEDRINEKKMYVKGEENTETLVDTETVGYDETRKDSVATQTWNSTANSELSLEYIYDDKGRIAEIKKNGETLTKYTYDTKNQLEKEENVAEGKTTEFVYDGNGNILQTSQSTYEYDSQGRMTSYNGESCTYDELGRPTVYRGYTTTWDASGKLSSYKGASFVYDRFGRLTSKNGAGMLFDNSGRLLKAGDLDYYYDECGVTGVSYNGAYYLFRRDILGNIIQILDSIGNVVVEYEYDAWGNHKVLNGNGVEITDSTHIGNKNVLRYRGYIYDAVSGLYYLNARFYDPETGRFISMDDISYADVSTYNGLNLYAYCRNNPISYIDLTGEKPVSWSDIGVMFEYLAVMSSSVMAGIATNAGRQDICNTISKVAPSIGKAASLVGGVMIATEAVQSIATDRNKGVSIGRALSDAAVDVGISICEIAVISTAVGTIVPIAGNLVGFVIGLGIGAVGYIIDEEYPVVREIIKDVIYDTAEFVVEEVEDVAKSVGSFLKKGWKKIKGWF